MSTFRKVCAKCNVEMYPKRNQVQLIHFINGDSKSGIDMIQEGDLWECPKCHCEVVCGLAINGILGYQLSQEQINHIYADMKTHPERYIEVKR